MKATLKFWTVLLCAGLALVGCCDDPITPENPDTDDDNPIVEQPLTDGSLFTLQLNNDIMATVGNVTWNAIAYGNGKYVAVGENGQIAYSSNGVSWTLLENIGGTRQEWLDVVYGNGKFVAVGSVSNPSTPRVAYSSDGISWTHKDITFSPSSIAYGNGKFVAVGGSGDIGYSSDGINWTDINVSSFASVTYGNGKFVASGNFGTFAYSSDGVSWTKVSVADNVPGGCIAFGNGVFVTGNNLSEYSAYSTDGINWTANNISAKFRDIAYFGDYFVAVGNNGIFVSGDGINWSSVNITLDDPKCVCIMQ